MSKLEATMVLNQWKVERKAYNDKVQRERRKSVGTDITTSDIEHSGVLIPQLRMMTEVKASPLLVGHTFPSKEPLLLMRIAEEANYTGCRVFIKRSDDYRVQCNGCDGSSFCVRAVFSPSTGWKITKAETRDITMPEESEEFENVPTEADGLEVEENDEDADGMVGDADGDADVVVRVAKSNRVRSPMKSRWLFPIIKEVIAKMPNLSNREMMNLPSDYIKTKFLTISLLQNARTFARTEVFGDAAINVFFANGLVEKMKEGGHHIVVVIKERSVVMKMLERVVLSEEMTRNKAAKKLMTKAEKISYVTEWKAKNRKMLIEGGVWPPKDEVLLNPLKFLSGIFFAPSNAPTMVPHLQTVF